MIKPNFTMAQVRKAMDEHIKNRDQAIIRRLELIGEEFINNARAKNTYQDQSGNLRSSIGYLVARNGKRVSGSTFESVKGGAEGSKQGKKRILELLRDHQEGYVLICVAGMDYAAAVESKGKDVLTGSSVIAKKQLQAALKSIK